MRSFVVALEDLLGERFTLVHDWPTGTWSVRVWMKQDCGEIEYEEAPVDEAFSPEDNARFIALRSANDPWTHAPYNWTGLGLPYGAWCACHKCGRIGRSTFHFDFFSDGDGGPLECQTCRFGRIAVAQRKAA